MKIKDFDYYWKLIYHSNNLWCTNNNKILLLGKHKAWNIVHLIYYYCTYNNNKWLIDNIKILKLQDSKGNRVIHDLAKYHPYWTTKKKKLLKITNDENTPVESILIDQGKI